MERIIIIGNSGAARECHLLFQDMYLVSPFLRSTCRFKGFLRHGEHKGDLGELTSLELASDADYEPLPEDRFVIGIGDPKLRLAVYSSMKAKGARFINLVSPWVYVPADADIGEANIIGMGCVFSCNVRIGNANYLNGAVRLAHDVHVGDGNFFAPESMALGNVRIGDGNSFGVRCTLLENSKIGNNNRFAPCSVIYKGCRDNVFMAGNPAIKMDAVE